ncbi:MAG: teichuronic acid biosynthesis glycosyltransferase TuaC [Chlamydiales bacterium]|jgi:teichuronic acid biosynthesis glycosyltransferase TuaC
MNIAVLTSLYPSPPRPFEGIFAERRWLRMAARNHAVRLIHPQPFVPPWLTNWMPLAWQQIARMPRSEERTGIPILRPRYLHLPGRARGNARRFVRCAMPHLTPSDVVVCDYAWPASNVAPNLKRLDIPCVISGRGSDVLEVAGEAGLGDALGRNLRAARAWCAVSQDLVQAMDRLAGEERGVLVPNGVDLDTFRLGDRNAARAQLNLPAGIPIVLVLGHLIPRKDPVLSLDSFLAGASADALLLFIGEGPSRARLESAIAERGAGQRVRLLGEKTPEEIAVWLTAADLLLLTSRREGRPNVVLEALGAGRPVLATDAGGTAEVLPDERMLARTRDPQAIGAQLAALLADPPQPEGLRASVEPLSWEHSTAALEACLDAAVHRGGAAR